jgi:hypothetical protein
VSAPDTDSAEEGQGNIAPPRDSSRRSRIDDLEEMMMMEAIRLSLASEEDRRRREEKEIRKEAKRREKEKEKEAKKADKAARKTGLYSNNASTSALSTPVEGVVGKASSSSSVAEEGPSTGKGKAVDRATPSAAVETPPAASSTTSVPADQSLALPDLSATAEPSRPSHLRHVSSASSSISSIMEANAGERTVGADGTSASLEPLFNFRSLAAVIGDDEKGHESEHIEDTTHRAEGSSSATPSVHQPSADAARDSERTKSEKPSVVKEPVEVQDSPGGISPKELETRSVEITNEANTEATS